MFRIGTGFLLLLFAFANQANAQKNFAFSSSLPPADSNEFYRIPLSAIILARCKGNMNGIRLYDNSGKEVPFIMNDQESSAMASFVPFPILSKTIQPDKKMHVVIRNTEKLVEQLMLEIQNTAADRTVNISGSPDTKQWFIIKENIPIHMGELGAKGAYNTTIDIPPVTYSYLDISFNNKDLLPANIISAGSYFYNKPGIVAYDTIGSISVTQHDSSSKRTYGTISFSEAWPFESMLLRVTGAPYFRRLVTIGDNNSGPTFTLSSAAVEWFPVNTRSTQVAFNIQNDDNPPLRLVKAAGLLRKQWLYTWLEKGKTYSLYFGDSLAGMPGYDLKYFKDLVPGDAPSLLPGSIKNNEVLVAAPPAGDGNKKWLWLAMGIGLAVLLFFTFRMTKELNKPGSAKP
ncbi:MAG: hypothetical protein ABIX01_22675 [Chitinophagaceae bacterium]